MATSGSKKVCRVRLTAEENSKCSSSSGIGEAAKEDSEVLPVSGIVAYVRDREAGDFHTGSDAKSRSATRGVRHTISSGPKMDIEKWRMLDDHLLEKIFARLPLKSLFQVSSLSRFWRARFRSPTFRSEVRCSSSGSSSASGSWNSYTPLFGNRELELVGYESISKQWRKLTTYAYLEPNGARDWQLVAGAGSLLCWMGRWICDHPNWINKYEIHVTNPLTKSWKQLPCRPRYMSYPNLGYSNLEFVQVILEEGSKAYKVLVSRLDSQLFSNHSTVRLDIYDSKDDAWIMESYEVATTCALTICGTALRNGVLYVFLSKVEFKYGSYSSCSLISYHVKGKMWNEILDLRLIISTEHVGWKPCFRSVLIPQHFSWTSDVMMVLHQVSPFERLPGGDTNSHRELLDGIEDRKKTRSVFRIDVQRGLAFEESKDSDSHIEMADEAASSLSSAAELDDCVYIPVHVLSSVQNCKNRDSCTRNLYNVKTQRWFWLDSPPCASGIDKNKKRQIWPLSWLDDLQSLSGIDEKRQFWPLSLDRNSVVYQPGLNPFLEV